MITTQYSSPATAAARRAAIVSVGAFVIALTAGGPAPVVNALASPGLEAGDHTSSSDNGRKGTVWVVNRDKGELAIFDAETGEVLKQGLPVGAGAHDICISEHAGKAYITAESINAVTALDLETLATESIAVGPLPHHIEPSHDGRLIYVSLASHTPAVGAPRYAVIDTGDHTVTYTTSSANP